MLHINELCVGGKLAAIERIRQVGHHVIFDADASNFRNNKYLHCDNLNLIYQVQSYLHCRSSMSTNPAMPSLPVRELVSLDKVS